MGLKLISRAAYSTFFKRSRLAIVDSRFISKLAAIQLRCTGFCERVVLLRSCKTATRRRDYDHDESTQTTQDTHNRLIGLLKHHDVINLSTAWTDEKVGTRFAMNE